VEVSSTGSGQGTWGRLAFLVFLFACACGSAAAQEITATLRGKVLDPGATPMPGVPVTVSSASRGGSVRTVVTDLQGRYKFPLLAPASDYFLQVSYPGYASTELGPIDLDAGKTTLVDISLQTAEKLTERIEVMAHGNVVDTTSTKSSTTFNTEFVEGLPIIGRRYQDILTLTSGVTDTDGDGNPNVQGARETGLQYRLDGSNITDPASGTSGQNLNIDAIEEIEVITAGAGAESGRADGGFANIITKSGGNDFQGTFRLVWQGQLLNGDGAGENNDTFATAATPDFDLRDFSPFLTLGGAFVQDRLWYFASYQSVDRLEPLNIAGFSIHKETLGHTFFGKVTWQADADNKLAFQYSEDPYEIRGKFLDLGVDADSDIELDQGARTTQIRWTTIASPTLLVETLFSYYDGGVSITPASDLFHVTHIDTTLQEIQGQTVLRASYPVAECSSNGSISGFIPNCDPSRGNPSIYQIDNARGLVTGPYPDMTDDVRLRASVKADVTYSLEDAWGEHQIKAGLEFADERFTDEPVNNPFFVNNWKYCSEICTDPPDPSTCPPGCLANGMLLPDNVLGFQVLIAPTPVRLDQQAESFNSAIYLQDVWKPRPNLTVQLGLRLDQEAVDTSGYTPFDPREEKRQSIAIVEGLCDDGIRVARFGSGESNADNGRVCDDSTRIPGEPPQFDLKYRFDTQTPRNLRKFDTNLDGFFDSGVDGSVWFDPYTVFIERSTENFSIENLNLSPRFSASWDPAADGRTKLYATWGRYYDRLFLDTVDDEIGPDIENFVFFSRGGSGFNPGELSSPASAASLAQVDRNLKTPFTDVFTVGVERELAPEWAGRLIYTQRLGWELLQDTDLNHLECSGFPREFDIRKQDVCALFTDPNGKVHLTDDQFGTIEETGQSQPNGAPDLYIVNPGFNQVLRTGNYNSSKYRAITAEIQRRLHRNWQMQLSYTFSRAYGQAEEFGSTLGNDPSTSDDEEGYLDFDQRHRVILLATTHLPKDIELGTTIAWETGTPYSVIAQVAEVDSDQNVSFRTFYPTEQRNDQRNNGAWKIDAKIARSFILGPTTASASLAVNNLLNDDDLTIGAYRAASFTEIQLQRGPQGLRRFGRYWELGFSLNF